MQENVSTFSVQLIDVLKRLIYYFYVCVLMWIYLCPMSQGAYRVQKRVDDPLSLELQVTIGDPPGESRELHLDPLRKQ